MKNVMMPLGRSRNF